MGEEQTGLDKSWFVIDRVFAMLSRAGGAHILAELYLEVKGEVFFDGIDKAALMAKIEEALNGAIPGFVSAHGSRKDAKTLAKMNGLPESTYVAVVGFLDDFAEIFGLRNRTDSEKVKDACDDALIEMFGIFERFAIRGDLAPALHLARMGSKEPLSPKVMEARDAMLKRIISKLEADANDASLLAMATECTPPAARDAAIAALNRLGNLPEGKFSEAVEALGYCGDLPFLASKLREAVLPESRKAIENAMMQAMDVLYSSGWDERGKNAGRMWYEWGGHIHFTELDGSGCSDAVLQKASEVRKMGAKVITDPSIPKMSLPADVAKKVMDSLPRRASYQRVVKLYLQQERHRNRDKILDGETVKPPERGTSSPAGRRVPHMRQR